MPFALLIIGAVLLISAVKGTTDSLFALVTKDFTNTSGRPSFIYWLVAILLIGGLGYIPKLKPVSVSLLGLVVLVLFLTRGDPTKAGGGFFEKFTAGLGTTTTAATPAPSAGVAASSAPSLVIGPGYPASGVGSITPSGDTLGNVPGLPMLSSLVH